MSTSPYIPNSDADFASWLSNFAAVIAASPTTYFLAAGDAAAISAQQALYNAAYLAATSGSTRGPATVAAKDAARTTATQIVRPYAVTIAGNPAISNDDKVAVGVTVRSTTKTPVPPPTTAPVLSLVSAVPNALNFQYRDAAAPLLKQKPAGVIGLQLNVAFGTVPAVSPDATAFLLTATKTPFTVDTTGQTGKVATFYARWVTRGGPAGIQQNGPWSAQFVTTAI
jgi:hypothetical protein